MRFRFGPLWQHADFRRLWAGQTISLFGSAVTTLALPLLAVLQLGATPLQMGILNAMSYAPFLVVTLFAGVFVDRWRRREIMIVTNLGRALLIGLIPLLALLGWLRIEQLYLILFLSGTLTVFFELAYLAFLPTLVEREQLVDAQGKLFASASVAEIGGPGLAGLLVQMLTAPFAIILDALSFLFAGLGVWLIRTPEPPVEAAAGKRSMWQEISIGLRAALGSRYLRFAASAAGQYNLFWNVNQAVQVLYMIEQLRLSPGAIGLILMLRGVGALCGALLTGQLTRRFGYGPTVVGTSMLYGVPFFLMPLLPGASPLTITLLVAAFFMQGLVSSACNITGNSIRLAIIPEQLRGRIYAFFRLVAFGTIPIGALLGGALGQTLGLRTTLLVGATGLSCCWLWHFFSPAARMRKLPQTPEEAAFLLTDARVAPATGR